jgi:hypothetical protein
LERDIKGTKKIIVKTFKQHKFKKEINSKSTKKMQNEKVLWENLK